MSLGFRVMSEFVAAVVVGGFIGWAIDRWLGISPAGLIVFGALGTAAGFWNVYRIAAQPSQDGMGRRAAPGGEDWAAPGPQVRIRAPRAGASAGKRFGRG